jgi:hypothetical protein
MTKSTRLMFLGFLVMLAGAILLYSLATAIPAGTNGTINPLVSAFYQPESCTSFSGGGVSCSGLTNAEAQAQFMSIIQGEELVALGVVLIGLILGIVGCLLRDSPTRPAQPAQPVTSGQPAGPASPVSTP